MHALISFVCSNETMSKGPGYNMSFSGCFAGGYNINEFFSPKDGGSLFEINTFVDRTIPAAIYQFFSSQENLE